MLPFSFHCPKIYNSFKNLEVSSSTTITCSTFVHARPRLPTITSQGLVRIRRASISTFFGKVAENSTTCFFGLEFSIIFVIWGSNPKSNILSASSMTIIESRFKLDTLPLFNVRISSILPGVQMISSAPFFRSASWFCTLSPPYTETTRMVVDFTKFLASK